MTTQKEKEKEQEAKLKELRRELEEQMLGQLPPELMAEEKIRVEIAKMDEGIALEPAFAKQVIEALLFASSKPLTVQEIRKVIKSLTPSEIAKVIEDLKTEYVQQARSFEIIEIANGFEIVTKKEFAPWILKIEMQKKAKQVTQSALETLAIMAYKQPITRAEIEELRGVDASGVVTTLAERGLVKIVGRKEVPGRPFLYATTEKFLEHFGLKSIDDLPNIEEIKHLVESAVKKEELLGKTQKIIMEENALQEQAEGPVQTLEAQEKEESDESQSNPQEN